MGPFPGGGPHPSEQDLSDLLRELRVIRPPPRVWIGLVFIAAGLLVLLVTAPLVGFLTEVQWFQALELGDVYLTRFLLQTWLFASGLVVALAFLSANVIVAARLRAGDRLRSPGIRRRRLFAGAAVVGLVAAGVISLILAASAGASWQQFVLFLHSSPTGVREPVFQQDVSFYLLTLPFLHVVTNWLLALLVLAVILVTALYAWRRGTFDLRLSRAGIAHLSALAGGLALVAAAGTFLGRYDLLYQHHGVVWGAGYADVHARAPLAVVSAVLAVILAAAFFANVRLKRPGVIIGCGAVWAMAAVLATIYPAIVQRFAVQPSELARETAYLSREIEFTRRAFGLDQVHTRSFSGDRPITRDGVEAERATVDNLRLWDNRRLQETYTQLQSIRTYYSLKQIDVDRYTIDGRAVQVAISARELDPDRLPPEAQRWVNQKLEYTHGYGVAASPVSAVAGEGLPSYVVRDVPPTGPLKVTRPEIYFGQTSGDHVLAPSAEAEFDYPRGAENVRTSYRGSHGVPLDGGNRLLWSLRTGDLNLLLSSQVQDSTQVFFRRDVSDRVSAIAPFLKLDSPYVVVVDGRLLWVVDAYTSGDTYPYAQREGAADNQNYLRNSVKVVVDAYEGTTDFYVADVNDPIVRAYRSTFPTLFKPMESMPDGLRAHLRVPPKLFHAQSDVYRTYHVTNPAVFYNREDVWDIPSGLDPYYVEMRLPGESQAEYLQILPFTPFRKQNLVSWLAVRNDAPHYGEMVSFVLPKDKVVLGPQQIASRIQQTPEISRDRTLLNSQGSSVIEGNLLAVPVGDSFLYFQPWYLKSTTTSQSLPELKKVILADATGSGQVAYQGTLEQALDQLVGGRATPPSPLPGSPPGPERPASPAVAALVQQAVDHYKAAQEALRQGNLSRYGQEMAEVGRLLDQIAAIEKRSAPPTSEPSGVRA